MVLVSEFTFDKDNYTTDELFWADIATFMRICTQNDYEVKFFYEDCNLYTCQVTEADWSLGGSRFMLVTPEEMEFLQDYRMNQKENERCEDSDELPFG